MIPKSRNATPTALDKIIQERLGSRTVKTSANLRDLPLMDFITTASPTMKGGVKTLPPLHLSPVLPFFDQVEKGPTIFCFSAPPRHGKSVLTNHFVARLMLRRPGIRVVYGSYGLDLSEAFSSDIKNIFVSNNIELNKDRNTRGAWELANGSSLKAVAPGTAFTGFGSDLTIIDDPYKDRQEAQSGAVRDTAWAWMRDVVMTRREPGASIIVTHTRWHYQDIIGVLSRENEYPFVNMPAINEAGEALWPERYDAATLAKIRKDGDEYSWASLYMGQPLPAGGAVFRGVNTYEAP